MAQERIGQLPPLHSTLRHAADFEKEFALRYEPGGWHPAETDER